MILCEQLSTKMKPLLKTFLIFVSGIFLLMTLLSGMWHFLVKSYVKQFSETTLSQQAFEAKQEALTEKASYQAAEYRAKRVKEEAQSRYELERLRLKIEMLPHYTSLKFYSGVGIVCILGISLVVLAYGYTKARIQQTSICKARIGPHSEIPVHYKDLPNFYPIAINLSLAEIQASISTSHENAYQISRQMIEDITSYTRAIAGQRGLWSSAGTATPEQPSALSGKTFATRAAELLSNGIIASGKSLFLGYDQQGQPQYRSRHELKTLAVAGWQGREKARTMAYLAASSVLADGVHVYVIDPYNQQQESVSSLLQPLEQTSRITMINPFYTPKLIRELHATLKRRRKGQESATPGIMLVIDELAGLANMDYFSVLLALLEECTEDTEKTNMTFMGSSDQWNTRHFHGRNDLQQYMSSLLIHKSKPSHTELLLEDPEDKHLVRQLHHPGEAVLMTDYHAPAIVSLPVCTREDIQKIASMAGQNERVDNDKLYSLGMKHDARKKTPKSSTQVKVFSAGMKKLSQA